jgi:hypothetical protein
VRFLNHNYTAKENNPERILDKGLNMILKKELQMYLHKREDKLIRETVPGSKLILNQAVDIQHKENV